MAFSPETWVLLIGKIKKLQEEIDSLRNALHWRGVTTTPITDGQDANPIVVDGRSIAVYNGDVTAYGGAEFVYDGSVWQQFGRDDSTYILKANLLQTTGSATDNVMSQKATSDELSDKLSRTDDLASTVENSDKVIKGSGIYSALQQKQDTLTFDNTPTQNSDNPVKSKGIYQAIQDAISSMAITVDDEVTESSENPVKSSGIYAAIYGLKLSITNGYLTLNEELQFSMELTENALSMIGSAEIDDNTIIIDGPVAVENNSMVYPA